jgi:hypothetical protein
MNKSNFNNCIPVRTGLTWLIMILILFFPLSVFCWDGFDYDTGNYIEIDDLDIPVIAPGTVIQIYDNEDSNHHTIEIMSVVKTSDETNIEVFDQDTDEYRNFEMESIKVDRT